MVKNKYLRYLPLASLFGTQRTRELFQYNPTILPVREEAEDVKLFVYDYDANYYEEHILQQAADSTAFKNNGHITWINIDGLRKAEVEAVCAHFNRRHSERGSAAKDG